MVMVLIKSSIYIPFSFIFFINLKENVGFHYFGQHTTSFFLFLGKEEHGDISFGWMGEGAFRIYSHEGINGFCKVPREDRTFDYFLASRVCSSNHFTTYKAATGN